MVGRGVEQGKAGELERTCGNSQGEIRWFPWEVVHFFLCELYCFFWYYYRRGQNGILGMELFFLIDFEVLLIISHLFSSKKKKSNLPTPLKVRLR